MNAIPGDNPERLLEALRSADLDQFSPEEVARIEGLLNSRPDLASVVGEQPATPDAGLASVLRQSSAPQTPSASEWESVWENIETAPATTANQPSRRWLHWWTPLTAIAAGLLLGIVWRSAPAPTTAPWPLQLATDVEIQSLEVYGDATPMIVSTGGTDSIDVIWVLEDEG